MRCDAVLLLLLGFQAVHLCNCDELLWLVLGEEMHCCVSSLRSTLAKSAAGALMWTLSCVGAFASTRMRCDWGFVVAVAAAARVFSCALL
jgi:hypothetical protein